MVKTTVPIFVTKNRWSNRSANWSRIIISATSLFGSWLNPKQWRYQQLSLWNKRSGRTNQHSVLVNYHQSNVVKWLIKNPISNGLVVGYYYNLENELMNQPFLLISIQFYRFNRLPFGLKTTPMILNQTMEHLFDGKRDYMLRYF